MEGCVFYFLNEPKLTKKKKTINKILSLDFFVSNELKNVNKMYKIPHYKHFFYLFNKTSELKLTKLDDHSQYLQCASELASIYPNVLLSYDDRGIIYLKNYLKALSSPKIYISSLIQLYKKLLQSIHLLVDNQLVHNHLRFDSIVLDKHCCPLITGFSFSMNLSDKNDDSFNNYMKHFFMEYDPDYLEWPMEFHMLSYLLTNKLDSLSKYNMEHVISEVIEKNTILQTFGPTLVSSYKEKALNFFEKYVNQSYEDILKDIIKYYCTWDNYALSILFLRMLINVHQSTKIKNKCILLWMKLLVNNIHIDPLKRLSIETSVNQFDTLLESLEPKDYKELLTHLMST
jgi:hypothetical protein